jgi:hypothetical protein
VKADDPFHAIDRQTIFFLLLVDNEQYDDWMLFRI